MSSINFKFLFPVFCSPQLFAFSYVLVLCQNISNFLKYVTTKWFNENFSAYILYDMHSKVTFLIEIGHDMKIAERDHANTLFYFVSRAFRNVSLMLVSRWRHLWSVYWLLFSCSLCSLNFCDRCFRHLTLLFRLSSVGPRNSRDFCFLFSFSS